MMRNAVATLAGLVLAFMLWPPLAGACNYPSLGLNKTAAGPGERVGYTITDAQAGAEYTLTIAGIEVVRSTSRAVDGHSGTFQTPDLQSNQRVSVELVVSHAGSEEAGHETGPWRDSKHLDFTLPPAGTTAPPQAQAVQDSPPPAEAGAQAEAPAAAGPPAQSAGAQKPQRSTPVGARARADRKPAATSGAARARAADPPPRAAAAAVPTVRRTETATVGSGAERRATPRGRAPAAAVSRARVMPPAAMERPPTAPRAVAPAPGAVALAGRADASGPSSVQVAGLALILGILAQVGVLASRRRFVPAAHEAPQPPGAETIAAHVEAELQQILAEAEAEAERAAETAELSTRADAQPKVNA